jgi:hypothetical protein
MWSAAVLRHLPASFGAAAADLSAVPHHVVSIGQTFAVFGAAVANFGAHSTGTAMKLGIAQHEICGALADLGTVEQQNDVFAASVIAAFVQTMRHSLQTNVVAIGHDFDVLIGLVSHDDTSSFLEYAQNICRSRDEKT